MWSSNFYTYCNIDHMGRKLTRKRMSELGKASAAKRARIRAAADEAIVEDLAIVSSSEVDIAPQPVLPPIVSWNNMAEIFIQKYNRSGGYSKRHIRRLKQRNRENAKGSRTILDFFHTAATSAEDSNMDRDSGEGSRGGSNAEGTPDSNRRAKHAPKNMSEILRTPGVFATPNVDDNGSTAACVVSASSLTSI